MASKRKIRIHDPDRVLRLGRSLKHELRIRVIVAHANGGPASATMLARDGLGSFGNVAYHQLKLCELGVLKLVHTEPRRGAKERLYDLTDFGREVLKVAGSFGRKQQ